LVFAALACFAVIMAVAFLVLSASSRRSAEEGASVSTRKIGASKPMSTDFSMYGVVLVPTDGSENSRFAVDNAIDVAKKNRSSIIALFVIDTEKYAGLGDGKSTGEIMREAGKEESEAAIGYVVEKAEENGIDVTAKVVIGRPAEEIVKESRNADLVVCGSLGRTNLKRAMMGSVAEAVVRMAHCPVLVCRRTAKK
ncbi:MAG: universal stress protein, partial [Candidatus Methanomethylophilaceae archaeon]|nr:universal stress protein [Candidatus Methanomethylophilaceae archaeon]